MEAFVTALGARRLTMLAAVVIGCWLLGAGPASAATTTIGFDTFPDSTPVADGTVITNQYASQGLTFDSTGDLPVASAVGASAASPPNVANISVCFACEFFTPFADAHFSDGVGRQHVGVRVGEFPVTGSDQTAVLTLTAYDVGGHQASDIVAQSSVTVTAGAGFNTPLSVDSAQPNIFSFEVSARTSLDSNKPIGIDDVTFDSGGVGATPDFGVSAPSGINLLQGGSATVPVSINRINLSAGPVTLSVAGLPPGVSGTFAPNPTNGSTSTLTLVATGDAPRQPAAATITGTPAGPGVGPNPRSTQLAVVVDQDFTVAIGGAADADLSGCAASVPVIVTRSLQFGDPVTLNVSGLPAGVSAGFSPAVLTFPAGEAAQTAQLKLQAAPTGNALPPTQVTVTATSPGHPLRVTTLLVHGNCPANGTAEVQTIQITQGVQSTTLQPATTAYPPAPNAHIPFRGAIYPGTDPTFAKLVQGRKTIVRVYVALQGSAAQPCVPGVSVTLRGATNIVPYFSGFTNPEPLPGGPLVPDNGPGTICPGGDLPSLKQEGTPAAAFTFTLPPSWTTGGAPSNLYATIETAAGTPAHPVTLCGTGDCVAGNSFELQGLSYYDAYANYPLPAYQEYITGQGNGPPWYPPQPPIAFARVLMLESPLVSTYPTYLGAADITNLYNQYGNSGQSNSANSDVSDVTDDFGDPAVGVNYNVARGITFTKALLHQADNGAFVGGALQDSVTVSTKSPLTSIAHELGHWFGFDHASSCLGGGSNGQPASNWPPDQVGLVHGFALDPSTKSPYTIFGVTANPQDPTLLGQAYDFMSYCANTSETVPCSAAPNSPCSGGLAATNCADKCPWISVRNWNSLIGRVASGSAASARSQAVTPRRAERRYTPARVPAASLLPDDAFTVRAFVSAAGARIASITAGGLRTGAANRPSQSPYDLVATDVSGREIGRTKMSVSHGHTDGSGPLIGLVGVLKASRPARFEIVANGVSVATATRGGGPPSVRAVRVTSIRRGRVHMTWRSAGAQHATLRAVVYFSTNDGRTWRTVFAGPDRHAVALPTSMFQATRRARVRVAVRDGFSTAAATSRRLTIPHQAPVVAIISPTATQRVRRDALVFLAGQATDDSLELLGGGALRWYAGRRLIGSGRAVSVSGLPAGAHRIKLQATDRRGLRGVTSVLIRVAAVAPQFITLGAPRTLSPQARLLPVRVASDLPATLRIGRRAYRVSRRPRVIRVGVSPGHGTTNVRLRLIADRLTRTAMLMIQRR